jgi:hypothetical protein
MLTAPCLFWRQHWILSDFLADSDQASPLIAARLPQPVSALLKAHRPAPDRSCWDRTALVMTQPYAEAAAFTLQSNLLAIYFYLLKLCVYAHKAVKRHQLVGQHPKALPGLPLAPWYLPLLLWLVVVAGAGYGVALIRLAGCTHPCHLFVVQPSALISRSECLTPLPLWGRWLS